MDANGYDRWAYAGIGPNMPGSVAMDCRECVVPPRPFRSVCEGASQLNQMATNALEECITAGTEGRAVRTIQRSRFMKPQADAWGWRRARIPPHCLSKRDRGS